MFSAPPALGSAGAAVLLNDATMTGPWGLLRRRNAPGGTGVLEREEGGRDRKWRVESRTSSEAGSLMAASFAALDFRPVAENGGGGN